MRILRVGDPHCQISNLEESEKLMHFINDIALEKKIDRLEILGDLMHTHAQIRLEVLEFWNQWLDILSESQDLFVLVGNHDQTGDYTLHENSLTVFKRIRRKNLHIIENPQCHGIFAYMPYYHDRKKFIEVANNMVSQEAKILICHQTFSGSKYESGIYAPDGIDANLLNYDLIISGHIHSRQRFGNVIYPGTARWLTASDANQPKGLWLVEHDDITGKIIKEEFIDTSHVCTPILSVEWKEGDEMPIIPSNAKVYVELIGSSQWVYVQKDTLKGKTSIKIKLTDKKTESRHAGSNLEDFVKNIYKSQMDKDKLLSYMKEIGVV